MIGKVINNFEIISQIDEGGMGSVYRAKHVTLNKERAIKILHLDLSKHAEVLKRFKNEAIALDELHHPNIVKIHDTGEFENRPYIAMDLLQGNNLSDYIKNITGPIPEEKAINFFVQMLDAIDFAHSKNIIHRDVKPSNFFITANKKVITLDFGVAKILSDDPNSLKTRTGQRIGSLQYMSPEQVKGINVEKTTDIYSLGVTLFNMLTGTLPYNEVKMTEWDIQNEIVKNPLPKAKERYHYISDEIEAIIEKTTKKDSSERYQSCKELKEAIIKINNKDGDSVQEQLNQIIHDFAADGIITKGEELALKSFAEKHSLDFYKDIKPLLETELAKFQNNEDIDETKIYNPLPPKTEKSKGKKKKLIFIIGGASILTAIALIWGINNRNYNIKLKNYGNSINKADSLHKIGLYDSSLVYYQKALEYFENDSAATEKIFLTNTLKEALNYYYNAEYKKAFNSFEQASELGCGAAYYYMGELCYNGLGVKQDNDKGFEYAMKAEKLNFGMEYFRLGIIYSYGTGVDSNAVKADEYFLKAIEPIRTLAENGDPEAQGNLGWMYEQGKGVTKNTKLAEKWYLKAAKQGFTFVQSNLAYYYQRLEKYDKAIEWFTKAADQGHPTALEALGRTYQYGIGVPKDNNKAFNYYNEAAEKDYASSQSALGYMYSNGLGTQKDYNKAFYWYKKAAAQNNSTALHNLGYMYQKGRGTQKDYSKAMELYQKAVKNGNDYALISIAYLYEEGLGVSINYYKAFEYYLKAANKENDFAQNKVGMLYYYGIGVPNNNRKAKYWFGRASKNGNQTARDNYQFLVKKGY